MNNYITYINLLLFCILNLSLKCAEPIQYESGILTYKIIGEKESGSEIFYFKGDKTLKHKKIILNSDNSISETIEINDGKTFYVIDMINKTGIKIDHPEIFTEKNQSKEIQQQKQIMLQSFKDDLTPFTSNESLEKKEEIIFFGKPCKVLRNSFFKSYIWNNFTLRQEITFPIKTIKEITNINMNAIISDSKFIPDKNIVFSSFDTNKLSIFLSNLKDKQNNKIDNTKD